MAHGQMSHSEVKSVSDSLECSPSQHQASSKILTKPSGGGKKKSKKVKKEY